MERANKSMVLYILLIPFLLSIVNFIPLGSIANPVEDYFRDGKLIESGPFYDNADHWTECDTISIALSGTLRGAITGSNQNIYGGCQGFEDALNKGESKFNPPFSYFRFWNGAQILYKPIYAAFDIQTARIVFGSSALFLLLYWIFLISRFSKLGAAVLILTLLPSSILTIFSSTSTASTIIGLMLILIGGLLPHLKFASRPGVFLFTAGAFYTFWDFLIIPAATWSLCIFVCYVQKSKLNSKELMLCYLAYPLGAVFSNVSRWSLAMFDSENENVYSIIRGQLLFRLSGVPGEPDKSKMYLFFKSIENWIDMYKGSGFLVLMSIIIWTYALLTIQPDRREFALKSILTVIPIMLGTFVLSQHTYIHSTIWVTFNWVILLAILNFYSLERISSRSNSMQKHPKILK